MAIIVETLSLLLTKKSISVIMMAAALAVGNYDYDMTKTTRQPLPAAAAAQHKPGCKNNGGIKFGWWPDDTAGLDSALQPPPLASPPGRARAGDGAAANEAGGWPHGTPGVRRTIMNAGKGWEKSK